MEPRDDAGTLTLEIPSASGDFVWGSGMGELRWPGRVSADADVPPKAAKEMPLDGHCVFVTFFGEGGAAWCDAGKLTPFRAGFPGLARQTDSKSFGKAVSAAVEAFGRYLETEMTRWCVPESPASVGKPLAEGFDVTEIVNGFPGEILRKVREFACDAMLGDALEVAVVRSWVAVFARWMGRYVPLAEYNYYHGLPQFKENSEENSHDKDGAGNEEEMREDDGKKKKRSMAVLIAGLDLGVEEGEYEKWVDKLDVSRRRKKEDDPEIKDLNIVDDGAEEGLGTGRRERKKSKYLSYPYTLVNMRGRRMFVNPKSSEKKSGYRDLKDPVDATLEDGQVEKTPRSRAAATSRANAYQDENEFSLNEKIPPVGELLTELHVVALDAMCLVGSDFDHPIRGFFGRLRHLVYTGDSEVRSDAKLQASPSNARRTPAAENRVPVEEGKTPPQEGNGSIVEKGRKGNKKKLSSAMNKSIRAKKRSYTKKKSIDGIVKSGIQESVFSRGKITTPATPASQKADGSDGGTSLQKRKRRKKDEARDSHRANSNVGVAPISDAALEANGTIEVKSIKKRKYMKKKKGDASSEGGLTPMASARLEANSSEASKSVKKRTYTKKKEQASNDARLERASKDVGLTPTVITGTEANISEANRSADNDGKEEVNVVMVSAPTVPAAQGANVSGELTSVNIISIKKRKYMKKNKGDASSEGGLTPMASAGLEANSSEASKSVKKRKYTKKKEQVSNDARLEQASKDVGLTPTVITGTETNISEANRSADNDGKEEVNVVMVSAPTIPAAQDANVSGELTSANIISIKKRKYMKKKKKGDASSEGGLTPMASAGLEANSSEASKSVKKRKYTRKNEQASNDARLEQASKDVGLIPTVITGTEDNISVANRSADNDGEEEVNVVMVSAPTVPAAQDAIVSGELTSANIISIKKRKYMKKKKGDASSEGGLTPMASAGLEANCSEASKSVKKRKYTKKKEQASNDVRLEQASKDVGLTPTIITGTEANISEANRSAENDGKEEVNVVMVSAPTVPAAQDANVSGELTSANIISMKEHVNAEMVNIPSVPAVQKADGSGEAKSVGKTNRKKKAAANGEVVPAGAAPGEGMPRQKRQRKKKDETNAADGAVLAVPAFLDANDNSKPKKKWQRKKKEEAIATDGAVLAVSAFPDPNGGDKPKQKRQRKKKEETNATDGAVLAVPASLDASCGGKPKQKRERKKKEETNSDEGAALLLSFSNDVELPSKEELISTYSKFGALRESGTALLKESVSASVVFVKKSDAEKAFNSPDRDMAFGNNLAACQLQYLHGDSSAPSLPLIPASTPKLPLDFVKKNLENMISTLSASGLSIKDVLGSDIGMKLDLKESLVDEMSDLLKKVNNMLTGGPSSASGGASAAGSAT